MFNKEILDSDDDIPIVFRSGLLMSDEPGPKDNDDRSQRYSDLLSGDGDIKPLSGGSASDFNSAKLFKGMNYAKVKSTKHKYTDSGGSFATDARGDVHCRSGRLKNLLDSGQPVDPRLKASPSPRMKT